MRAACSHHSATRRCLSATSKAYRSFWTLRLLPIWLLYVATWHAVAHDFLGRIGAAQEIDRVSGFSGRGPAAIVDSTPRLKRNCTEGRRRMGTTCERQRQRYMRGPL